MNLSKQLENSIRESEIVAIDLTVADFTLQFAREVGLPCKKGINIRILWHNEGIVDVSVLILDLGKDNDLHFCIQNDPHEKTWEVCCLYPVHLTFGAKTPNSNLPAGFEHANYFRAKRDETGKFKFDKIKIQ